MLAFQAFYLAAYHTAHGTFQPPAATVASDFTPDTADASPDGISYRAVACPLQWLPEDPPLDASTAFFRSFFRSDWDVSAITDTNPRFALMVCNAGIAFGLLLLLVCAVFKSSRKPHLSAPHRHRINRRLTPVLVLNTPYLLDRSSGDIYLFSDSLDKNRPETWGTCAGNITDVDHNGQLGPKDQAAPGISPHEHRTEMRNGQTVGCPAGFSNLRSEDVQTPKETNATSTLRKQPGGMQSATFLMSDLAVISAAGFAVFLQLWHYPDQHLSRTINFLFLVQTLGSFAPGLYRIMRYRTGLFKPDGSCAHVHPYPWHARSSAC